MGSKSNLPSGNNAFVFQVAPLAEQFPVRHQYGHVSSRTAGLWQPPFGSAPWLLCMSVGRSFWRLGARERRHASHTRGNRLTMQADRHMWCLKVGGLIVGINNQERDHVCRHVGLHTWFVLW